MEGIEIRMALEEAQELVGARLGKVHQIGTVLILRFYGPSAALALDPAGKAVHRTDLRPPTPAAPPPFCQLVRRLSGQPLIAMEQAGYDRVVRFCFPGGDLVLDLRPRRGNVFVHWREGETEALQPGEPRVAPFGSEGDVLQGMGPGLRRAAGAARDAPLTDEALRAFAHALLAGPFEGHLHKAEGQLVASPVPRPDLGPPVDVLPSFWAALDRVLEQRLAAAQAQTHAAHARRALARHQRTLTALERGAAEAAAWEELKQRADLILARLSDIPAKTAEVTVEGFDGTPTRIELDPSLPPARYAQRLYRRAGKLRRRLEQLPTRRASVEAEIARLTELLATVREQPEMAPFIAPSTEPPPAKEPSPKPGGSRQLEVDGFPVRVGRSAEENDRLVRTAAPADLWLHARGVSGAHVIIKSGGRDVPPHVLERAAELAAWHSQARGERRVAVSYTEARHVRKPRKAPRGMVTMRTETVLYVSGQRGP